MLDYPLGMARIVPRFRFQLFAATSLSVAAVTFFAAAPCARAQDDAPSVQQSASPKSPAAVQKSPSTLAPAAKKRASKDFTLKGDSGWIDTGIDLALGEHFVVAARGTLRYADAKTDNSPDGLSRGFKDLLRILPFNSAGRGALIGRVGDADIAQPFLIGASHDITPPVGGRLSIAINQSSKDTGEGSYTVHIDVMAADAASLATFTVAKSVDALPGIDNSLFEKIPRRIEDKNGNSGDMVNFLILGSQAAMQNVFTSAGWVKVDTDVKDAVLHGLVESLSKESYLTMPMSVLYLFGRPQDYGWAHAEPINVVRTRNHLRIWKAPFTVNGETLWVGAATHDIGFERDERNNGLTHKIDPDIDLERDYVEKTLTSTGLVAQVSHFLPDNPMQEAHTATGGSFHSNGQVLILKLAVQSRNLAASSQGSR
jgi:hypothetical protein